MNLPDKYHLVDLVWQSKNKAEILGQEAQNVNQDDNNSNSAGTGTGVVIGSNNNQSQDQKETLAQFFQIPGDSIQEGDIIIEKDGQIYIAKNTIGAQKIERRSIKSFNLATGSVDSRVIQNHTIGSTDIKKELTLERLIAKDKISTDKLDLGENTITDGQGKNYPR